MNGRPKTSRLAIASFVLSLAAFIPIVPAVLAVILGTTASWRIRRSRGRLVGRGFALAGTILGVFVLMLTLKAFGLCLAAYDDASRVADLVLYAVGEGDIAAAGECLDSSFEPDDLLALDALSRDVSRRLGRYQSKRWARAFKIDYTSDNGYVLEIGYLVAFDRRAAEVPVRMIFAEEDGRWKLHEVRGLER